MFADTCTTQLRLEAGRNLAVRVMKRDICFVPVAIFASMLAIVCVKQFSLVFGVGGTFYPPE